MTVENFSAAINLIAQANPTRCTANLDRRLIKMLEELGELSEAFLSITSMDNDKNKTWADVQEEAVDVLIVGTDIALTPFLDEDDLAIQQRLVAYTCDNLHFIDLGFKQLLWRISGFNAQLADVYRDDPRTAVYLGGELVRHAFALNQLIDHPAPKQLCGEVTRKILKWKRRRPKLE
jgi:NTP pyrophosphatase (non-canonical NTP hydrolase)